MNLAKQIFCSVVPLAIIACQPDAPTDYRMMLSKQIQAHVSHDFTARHADGRVILRFRLNRSGELRYYKVEESSGDKQLDVVALDALFKATPFPPVPADYVGEEIDFLVPINFKAPSKIQ